MSGEAIKAAVRSRYGSIAKSSGCGCGASCETPGQWSQKLGYSGDELAVLPAGANLGLGCGAPVGLASVREGEHVLDLGSGAGIDCFLASRAVGPTGRVTGVDMTPEMVEKARRNASQGGYTNVSFLLGEIENLPVQDGTVDVVVSNCVINLVPDKPRAFREAFRVLRPGGRILVSDIVLLRELPASVRESSEAWAACVSGALLREDYLEAVRGAGFRDVDVVGEKTFALEEMWGEATGTGPVLASIQVRAVKP